MRKGAWPRVLPKCCCINFHMDSGLGSSFKRSLNFAVAWGLHQNCFLVGKSDNHNKKCNLKEYPQTQTNLFLRMVQNTIPQNTSRWNFCKTSSSHFPTNEIQTLHTHPVTFISARQDHLFQIKRKWCKRRRFPASASRRTVRRTCLMRLMSSLGGRRWQTCWIRTCSLKGRSQKRLKVAGQHRRIRGHVLCEPLCRSRAHFPPSSHLGKHQKSTKQE